MPTPNYATAIAPKPAAAIREQSEPAAWFTHTPPPLPGGLTFPDYPGWGTGSHGLNSFERSEVDRFLANPISAVFASLTSRAAIAKAGEFQTLFANPLYVAWKATSNLQRIGQWRNSVGSAVIGSIDAVPVSFDDDGSGTPPPDPILPPGADEP